MPTDQSMRALLGPQLPSLRRYARILTGSQAGGDHFVRAALEAIVEEKMKLDRAKPPKFLLFDIFHRFWNPHRETVQDNHRPVPGLHSIGREALLLTAVEGFSIVEASQLLSLDESVVGNAVARAEAGISRLIQSDVLIIEDEPLVALHLERLVGDMGHRVSGSATTHAEAVEGARRSPPDLVLADIQLADGSSGLEAVTEILDMFDVPVVFVTAYPERYLTGAKAEPTYLVSKPFDAKAIYATVGQALLQQETSLSSLVFNPETEMQI